MDLNFPIEDMTPLWARIGEGGGGFLWFLAMVFLAVTAISLFRAGRHPAAKGLRLAGLALFFWVGATMFGAILREVATFPPLVDELGYTGSLAVNVALAFVGGGVDFLLFALVMFGVLRTSKRLRTLADNLGTAKPAVGKPTGARPAVARPVVAQPSRVQGTSAAPRQAAQPPAQRAAIAPPSQPARVAQPAVAQNAVAQNAVVQPAAPARAAQPVMHTERLATLPPPASLLKSPANAPRRAPERPIVTPEIEAMIKDAGFAKPARVFTVREASGAPAASAATPVDEAVTREVDMSNYTLPQLGEEDEGDATLVQFPSATPAGGAQA